MSSRIFVKGLGFISRSDITVGSKKKPTKAKKADDLVTKKDVTNIMKQQVSKRGTVSYTDSTNCDGLGEFLNIIAPPRVDQAGDEIVSRSGNVIKLHKQDFRYIVEANATHLGTNTHQLMRVIIFKWYGPIPAGSFNLSHILDLENDTGAVVTGDPVYLAPTVKGADDTQENLPTIVYDRLHILTDNSPIQKGSLKKDHRGYKLFFNGSAATDYANRSMWVCCFGQDNTNPGKISFYDETMFSDA